MCVDNPIPVENSVPIIAYKVMNSGQKAWQRFFFIRSKRIISSIARNEYELGKEYLAEEPLEANCVSRSTEYEVGFHAYQEMEDAINHWNSFDCYCAGFVLVQVELSGDILQGYTQGVSILVATKCKFIKILE